MPDKTIDWILTGVFSVGFAALSYLLNHWFTRIDETLEKIWQEVKESRAVEGSLWREIEGIKARCEERHQRRWQDGRD